MRRRERLRCAGWLIWLIAHPNAPGQDAGEAADLVEVVKLDSTIRIELRYASANNFLGTAVYSQAKCYLQREVAERLVRAHRALRRQGYGIKIWDGYRPLSVQQKLWEKKPNPLYVADPRKGSRHSRGAAVDVTLVDLAGRDVEMPTDHDEFSARAHPSYNKVSETARRHRQILIAALTAEGFTPITTEWWHFDAPGWRRFPLLDIPFEQLP